MRDLKSPGLIWAKAILFVIIGLLSVTLILIELPDWRIALLLALAIWAFCRAYYFAFYVIEHYLDPSFRYAGLLSVVRHLWKSSHKAPVQKEANE